MSLEDPQATRRRNAPRPHMVYEFYDARGEAVYVGFTVNIAQRLASHQSAPFWPEVAEVRATLHADRFTAQCAEIDLIRELQPRWNFTHTEQASENARERHRQSKAQRSA